MATDGQPAEPFCRARWPAVLGPGNRRRCLCRLHARPRGSAPVTIEGTAAPIARIVCQAGTAAVRRPPAGAAARFRQIRCPNAWILRGRFALRRVGSRAGVERQAPLVHGQTRQDRRARALKPDIRERVIHLHGHSFRLLDALDDGWKPFWLDTLPLAPGTDARIAFVADNPRQVADRRISRQPRGG